MDRKLVIGAAAVALAAAAAWAAFLGWDHEYYDVEGVAQGPYRAWQVIGAGVAVAAATVLAHLRVRRRMATVALPVAAVLGFAIPWGWDAGRQDETGMWVVGLLMILIGGVVALTLLLLVVDAVRAANGRSKHRMP